MRYFIQLSYHGAPFCGWQRQPDQPSVQETIEDALGTILRQPTPIVGAGRTDTGVHARMMYAHVDLDSAIAIKELPYKLNSLLPESIAIQHIHQVGPEAHARFDAIQRGYEYHIHTEKDPFVNTLSYYHKRPLRLDLMNEAAQYVLGKQDFQCFSKVKTDVKTYFCDVKEAQWRTTDKGYVFAITADRFLRNMVRAIVGTLIYVGLEKAPPLWIKEVIAQKNRGLAGTSVPAHGLFLTNVVYPPSIFK